MSDALRYRIVDEPRPGPLGRFALPPLLVFLVGQFFLPWGMLLLAGNALALNGPRRAREVVLALAPIVIWYGVIAVLDAAVRADVLTVDGADYVFVAALGVALLFAANAYVSQEQTAQLRRYLRQQG